MGANFKIWVALTITVVCVLAGIWQVANLRGMRARGRRRSVGERGDRGERGGSQRRSDTRALNGAEKKLYGQATRLVQHGKIGPAARILEQLGMHRESIQLLEDNGMIHDAAKVLLRMQRANRAGVVYARHGMWMEAAGCFKMANMPLEVAKCAREAGDLGMAAEFFEKAGRFEEAGDCYEQLGNFLAAARHFAAASQGPKAIAAYDRLGRTTENPLAIELDDAETHAIIDYLGEGHTNDGLAKIIISRNKLNEVIRTLVARGLVRQASDLYLRASSDIGPILMAEVNYQDRSAACLAEVFMNVSSYHYAGMIFERMHAFDRAADAFEKAEDYERAAYCYERLGVDARARQLKDKARKAPYRGRPGGPGAKSPFALASVTVNDSHNGASGEATYETPEDDEPSEPDGTAEGDAGDADDADEGSDESTQMLEAAAAMAAAVPPPPRARTVDDSSIELAAMRAPAAPDQPEPGREAFYRAKFFTDLDPDQKNRIWAIGTTREYAAEQTILTYNDEPTGIYVIIQGSVACFKQVTGKEAYVDQMGEAESFGELWLLADQPTAVRFVATTPTRIRVVGRDAFNELLDKDGTIARKVYKRFTLRLLKRLLRPQNHRVNQEAS